MISVLAEKRLAFKLVSIARNFGSDGITPRIQIGKYRQGLRFWPTNTSHENWKIPPGILAPAEQRLAVKMENAAANFGSDEVTLRIHTGQYRQKFWSWLKSAARPHW